MFPFGWNAADTPNTPGFLLPFASSSRYYDEQFPEEVREGIESRKDWIHSEEELQMIADDLMLRR